MIQLADLQAWSLCEGLAMLIESSERLERLPPAVVMERLERLDELFAGMLRLEQRVEQVLEHLERSERLGQFTPAPERIPEAPEGASAKDLMPSSGTIPA